MKTMRLHWWRAEPNFGDALSPLLVERLSGWRVEYAPADTADMLGAGSVLYAGDGLMAPEAGRVVRALHLGKVVAQVRRRLRPMLSVWGAGLIVPWRRRPGEVLFREVTAPCVRGRMTERMLVNGGVVRQGCIGNFGDPGVLYKMLLPGKVERQYDVGVVPHAFDSVIGAYLHERIAQTGRRAVLVNVRADPLSVLKAIASCEQVVSSSLHGCIVADSLGIPNRQVVCSLFNMTQEQFFFKYRDYYSAFGEELPPPLPIGELLNDLPGGLRSVAGARRRSADKLAEIEAGLKTCLDGILRAVDGGVST